MKAGIEDFDIEIEASDWLELSEIDSARVRALLATAERISFQPFQLSLLCDCIVHLSLRGIEGILFGRRKLLLGLRPCVCQAHMPSAKSSYR